MVIVPVFSLLNRRPVPTGLFLGLFFALYGPIRFWMDTLRTGDARYLGWTPGQYVALAATLIGLSVLVYIVRQSRNAKRNEKD